MDILLALAQSAKHNFQDVIFILNIYLIVTVKYSSSENFHIKLYPAVSYLALLNLLSSNNVYVSPKRDIFSSEE